VQEPSSNDVQLVRGDEGPDLDAVDRRLQQEQVSKQCVGVDDDREPSGVIVTSLRPVAGGVQAGVRF